MLLYCLKKEIFLITIEQNVELSAAFSIGDEVLPGFYTAFERSVLNVSSAKLK